MTETTLILSFRRPLQFGLPLTNAYAAAGEIQAGRSA